MQVTEILAQTPSSTHWFIIVVGIAVAGALLFVFAAWMNRRWRK